MHLRLGTRGSQLALWQANYIATQLNRQGCSTTIIPYQTKGDKQLEVSIAKIGSKGVFTEELEHDLLNGTIDLAIHSAKDLQSTIPAGLELLAFTEREKAHDVILSLDPAIDLNQQGLVVGCSSTRRRAMLARYYPNIKTVESRGNLQTRLEKLKQGHFQAMLLAYAGVHRMGFGEFVVKHLSTDQFVPPTGQGTIAVQSASTLSPDIQDFVRTSCNHLLTEKAVLAERAYLKVLDGGCSIPVFAYATEKTFGEFVFTAGIISLDGKEMVQHQEVIKNLTTKESIALGTNAGHFVLENGGRKILKGIRSINI